jgi:putative DNA primase/helicase
MGIEQVTQRGINVDKTVQEVIENINFDPKKAHEKIIEESKKRQDMNLKLEVLSLLQRKCFGEASELLVAKVKKNNYIYTTKIDKAQEVLFYKDGIYVPNGESHIKQILRDVMEENYSEWLANQVMAKIKTDSMIDPETLFQETNFNEIPLENGILDLNTFELLPFDPNKIFLSKLPTKFDIEATCPLIDKFLTDVLASPEDKDVFYELAGFGLYKDYFMEKAFMMVGNGRNGKGKSIELLKRLVGTSNCASVPLSAMDANSPFVSSLWKRYFNLAGDISSKDLKETGMFKQLTGRDLISANRKYLNVVEFMNYAKLVFACNELPRVYDYSDGFWERWVLLEFPYKFVEQEVYNSATEEEKKFLKIKDPNIIDKISNPEEMSGFLNQAIAGLQRLRINKKFSYTKGTVEVKNRWIRKADSFMAFCMDCVEEDYESAISKKEMRRKYKEYCNLHKVGGVSDKSIKATLQEMFGVMEEYSKILGDFQENVWTGIKWKIKQI